MNPESVESRQHRLQFMYLLTGVLVGACLGAGGMRAEMLDSFRRHPCTYLCDQGICPPCDDGGPPDATMAPVQVRPLPVATPEDLP